MRFNVNLDREGFVDFGCAFPRTTIEHTKEKGWLVEMFNEVLIKTEFYKYVVCTLTHSRVGQFKLSEIFTSQIKHLNF